MANVTISGPSLGLDFQPAAFRMRFGAREIAVSRDFRMRYSMPHRVLDCRIGAAPGHLELLLARTWLIVLSKARPV